MVVSIAVFAAVLQTTACPARAQMGASASAPLRHDIDARCDPLDHIAQRSQLIFPLAEQRHPGEDATGTYAHVLERHRAIAAVYLYTTETQAHGEVVTRDCYHGGRLQRMRTESVLGSGTTWVRTKYFADSGSLLTQTDTQRPAVAGGETSTGAPPRDEPVYRTVEALPFYRAYRSRRTAH